MNTLHNHPLLNRLFTKRGVQDPVELEHGLKHLLSYDDLLGIEQAVARLKTAIEEQQKIIIVGDFDCDGATATSVALSALKKLGAQQVSFLVPNRFEYGYGLTPAIVELAKQQDPDLIITVDNGISSIEGVKRANELGIDVIVTDHHLTGDELPQAYAIVNPNQPGDTFKSKNLAGVGVVFYVMCALRKALNSNENMAELLDLVALGTVADVVKLDHNNRILVQQGLLRIRKGTARPGIQALIEVAKRQAEKLTSTDLGFGLGPRLNAAGRLDDMSLGIQCLLAEDINQARLLAQQLDDLNKERREIEAGMKLEAFKFVEKLKLQQQNNQQKMPLGLCLYDKTWHQGVVGLVASRVKDQWHRPTIAFANSSDIELKGSARSVKGVHIRDVLDAIATKNPGVITKFGGHAMAAGLSLNKDKLETFSRLFAAEIARLVDEQDLKPEIETDGALAAEDINIATVELLSHVVPWGQGFVEPTFANEFKIVEQRLVGEKHLKMTLQLPEGGPFFDAIWFNVDLKQWPNHRLQQATFVYRLDVNEYNGRRKVQLIVATGLLLSE